MVGQQSLGCTLRVDVELGLSCGLGFWSWAYHSERNVCLLWGGGVLRLGWKQSSMEICLVDWLMELFFGMDGMPDSC